MMRTLLKIWNAVSSTLVALVVLLAVLLVGARVVGLQVYTVLSGSMEPTYHTGSLIYVKQVDPASIEVGQVITFMLDEDTIATHRVVGVVPDEDDPTVLRFRTKGDANDAEDGGLVHYKNVIGTPVFSIPYLGYVANYIQNPPGAYVAISAGAVLLLLVFLPDIFSDEKKKKGEKSKEKKFTGKNVKCGMPPMENISDLPGLAPEFEDGSDTSVTQHVMPDSRESLEQEVRRKTEGLLTDEEVQRICRLVESGGYDENAAESLQRILIARHDARKKAEAGQ